MCKTHAYLAKVNRSAKVLPKVFFFSVTSISIDFGYQSILIGELNRWIRLISDIDFYRLTTSAILIFRLSDSRSAGEKFTKKKRRFPRVRSPLTTLTAALLHLNTWNELISRKHPRLFHMKLPPEGGGGGSYGPLLLMRKVNFLFFDSKAVAIELPKLSCLSLRCGNNTPQPSVKILENKRARFLTLITLI